MEFDDDRDKLNTPENVLHDNEDSEHFHDDYDDEEHIFGDLEMDLSENDYREPERANSSSGHSSVSMPTAPTVPTRQPLGDNALEEAGSSRKADDIRNQLDSATWMMFPSLYERQEDYSIPDKTVTPPKKEESQATGEDENVNAAIVLPDTKIYAKNTDAEGITTEPDAKDKDAKVNSPKERSPKESVCDKIQDQDPKKVEKSKETPDHGPDRKVPSPSVIAIDNPKDEGTSEADSHKTDSDLEVVTEEEEEMAIDEQDSDEEVIIMKRENGEGQSVTPGDAKPRLSAPAHRALTLSMLIKDDVIQPGKGALSTEVSGRRFEADLMADGMIQWLERRKSFSSPNAWAVYCKRLVNPKEKLPSTWSSVLYKGKKLAIYRSLWLRKQKEKVVKEEKVPEPKYEKAEELTAEVPRVVKPEKQEIVKEEPRSPSISQPEKKPEPILPKTPVVVPEIPNMKEIKRRVPVKHASLGRRSMMHDPNILVECTTFMSLGKVQPFVMSISSSCLVLIDFHCHLTTSEVVGYLAGKWDPSNQHLLITHAFPCRGRLGDKENSDGVETVIRRAMELRGLRVAGWYHSHPTCHPDPSLRDMESQMEYQLKIKGVGDTFQPCISLIASPYDPWNGKKETAFQAVWIQAPPEQRPLDYGMPMAMSFDVTVDHFLPQDIFDEAQKLVDFYRGDPDWINFADPWMSCSSHLEKLKTSLSKKFPTEASSTKFLEFVTRVLSSKT